MCKDEEQRRKEHREYMQKYRQNFPKKELKWRINYAIKLLRENGYTVTTEVNTNV